MSQNTSNTLFFVSLASLRVPNKGIFLSPIPGARAQRCPNIPLSASKVGHAAYVTFFDPGSIKIIVNLEYCSDFGTGECLWHHTGPAAPMPS
mmetsp:Transcript_100421/g.173470  ORF Transcript_100421/g.173470 Transcript_100421/m.173470 type:complete len:92 (+) Transcript_100421:790-1065(+)